MKKISWVKIYSNVKYGGDIYEEQVRNAFAGSFSTEVKRIEAHSIKFRYFKPIEWLVSLAKLNGQSDLWLSDSFIVIALLPLNRLRGKKVALIYHIDNSVFNPLIRAVSFFLEKMFYQKLRKMDGIVTISNYWEKHFLDKGFNNVYKIYNGFDIKDFNVNEEEVADFKKRFGLKDKPIVYIGNCQKEKGIREIYEALKDLDVHLVTSGPEMVKIPAKNLNLKYRDYLRLLKASTVVLEMHKFQTGWSRISHEAMLFRKPVIGSGAGGTKELLEKSGQIICKDFDKLREKVEFLLDNPVERERLGEKGYNYAINFTREKFNSDWLKVVNNILNEN